MDGLLGSVGTKYIRHEDLPPTGLRPEPPKQTSMLLVYFCSAGMEPKTIHMLGQCPALGSTPALLTVSTSLCCGLK